MILMQEDVLLKSAAAVARGGPLHREKKKKNRKKFRGLKEPVDAGFERLYVICRKRQIWEDIP